MVFPDQVPLVNLMSLFALTLIAPAPPLNVTSPVNVPPDAGKPADADVI